MFCPNCETKLEEAKDDDGTVYYVCPECGEAIAFFSEVKDNEWKIRNRFTEWDKRRER